MPRGRPAAVLSVALLVAGCPQRDGEDVRSAGTTDSASAPAPPPAPTASAQDTPPSAQRWLGSWSSASCGERSHERILTLQPDGHALAADRISPCPAGATCVWSGIVRYDGRWKRTDAGLHVSLEPDAGARAGVHGPLELDLIWRDGGPASVHGSETCPYSKTSSKRSRK